nr:unnamed protein product [Brassica oleracea]
MSSTLYSERSLPCFLPDGSMTGGPKIATVNGVWIEKSRGFSPSCKDLLVNFFKAEYAQVDFRSKVGNPLYTKAQLVEEFFFVSSLSQCAHNSFQTAEEIRMDVNKWASHHTNGLIENLLPLGSVTCLTTQIYGNALYFKGVWQHKFNKSLTKYNDFYLLNGKYVRVPLMTSGQRQYIEAYDGFKVLGLPYRQGGDDNTNRKFSMYFYLPDKKDGLHNLLEKMASTHGFLDRHIPLERVIVGDFRIPKFKIEFGFEASKVFGDWKHEMSLYQKACVEIDEEGTEAVAVSARLGYCTSNGIVPKMIDFVADHPFLFLIREDKTGTVLFVGQNLQSF